MGIEKKDPANFSPSVEIPAKVDSFRFWCQKVLPLVYDDSLSYYELLCKVVNYLNNTIADVNTLGTDVDNLNNAYNELQSYVNNYFSTLDVQNEINNKLDVMAQDGSLSALIQPLFDTYKTEIDNEVNQQNNKIDVLENRMNTFTSLPSGSTTGDAELIDIRVPASGFNNNKAYANAGDAVRGQVSLLNKDFTQLGFSLNIMTNDFIDNHYRDFHDGVDREHPSYCEWDVKPIKSDTTYYFNTDAHITFFSDHSYSFISGVEIVGEGTFQTPSNASYITISFPMEKKEQVILTENKKPIFNIPIGVSTAEAIMKELNSKTSSNNIYVGANKDYTSLVRCFEYIRTDNLKNVTVIIDSGEYNLIDDVVSVYGQSFIDNYNKSIYDDVNGFKGLFLGNNINVVGNGRVVINCNYQGENDDFKLYFSPFHVYNKSYKITGINVISSNVRYCLHDDCYTTYGNNIAKIEKCEFVDNGNRAGACIGGGFTQGNDIVYINDCIFTSNSSNSIGFYYHTNPLSGKCIVKANNCLLNNCKAYINAYGNSNNKSIMYVSNSKMPMLPYKNKIGSDTDNVDIIYWNIEIPN